MTWVHRTMFVRAGAAHAMANALAQAFPSATNMWSVSMSTDGQPPAEWMAGHGPIQEVFADLLPCTSWERSEGGEWVATAQHPGNLAAIVQASEALGQPVTAAQVAWLFSQVDISDQRWQDHAERMGARVLVESAA
jgi:hypothetical protein